MELREKLKDYLQGIEDSNLRYIWNDFCDNNNYDDDRIYLMDDINDYLCGMSPLYILENYSWIDTSCRYIRYGIDRCSDYVDDLIDYIINNDEDFGYDDIRNMLDEDEGGGELEYIGEDLTDEARFEDEY